MLIEFMLELYFYIFLNFQTHQHSINEQSKKSEKLKIREDFINSLS